MHEISRVDQDLTQQDEIVVDHNKSLPEKIPNSPKGVIQDHNIAKVQSQVVVTDAMDIRQASEQDPINLTQMLSGTPSHPDELENGKTAPQVDSVIPSSEVSKFLECKEQKSSTRFLMDKTKSQMSIGQKLDGSIGSPNNPATSLNASKD